MPFPTDFVWGVSTSAYQIEGAAREDGRGPSIWDTFSHTPGKTRSGATGDVACDHYHRYREDIAMIADLGFSAYRFSVSWPRVQPLGYGAWNEAGWDFYHRMLDALSEAGLAAYVTLYHWDLPQALETRGGWRSRETLLRFADYAAEFVGRFGTRVKSIATHSEPFCTATEGHETGKFAPGSTDRRAAAQVSHHLLVSHGLALRAMLGEGYAGQLGIVLNQAPAYPADPDCDADRRAARLTDGLLNRWYLDPLFRDGYPTDVLEWLGPDAPQVTSSDLEIIRTPMDFLGVNYYNRRWCSTAQPPVEAPAVLGHTDMGWEIFPSGLTEHLVRMAREYRTPPILITENGAAAADVLEGDRIHDPLRVDYFRRHLDAVEQARAQGVDVRGYFAWSLMDNFEWDDGYAKRFGLIYVDYPTQQRFYKDSALWFQDFLRRQHGPD